MKLSKSLQSHEMTLAHLVLCTQIYKVYNFFLSFFQPYICELCPMRFNSNNSKMRHMRTHTKQKPYQCNLCPNSYRASHHLKYHKIQKHGTEADKKFRCSICGKAFAFNFILNAHMKDHCKGEKKQTYIEDEIVLFDADNYISS
jgi:uncharacterized Zn-finger protein